MRQHRHRLRGPISKEIHPRASPAVRCAIQPIDAAEAARAAGRGRFRIDQDLTILAHEQRNILAARNTPVRSQWAQQIDIEVLRIATKSLLKVTLERQRFQRIQIAQMSLCVAIYVAFGDLRRWNEKICASFNRVSTITPCHRFGICFARNIIPVLETVCPIITKSLPNCILVDGRQRLVRSSSI